MAVPLKKGQTPDIYFEGKYPWISDGDKFQDRLMYHEIQKEKKKGFNSADFKRRDEFSNTTRTEQYREQLGQEIKYRKLGLKNLAERPDVLAMDEEMLKNTLSHPSTTTSTKPHLYDLVYETDDKGIPASTGKTARDTKNPTLLGLDRKKGSYKTSSMGYGYGVNAMEHEKPMFARSPIVQSTFYRPRTIPLNNNP